MLEYVHNAYVCVYTLPSTMAVVYTLPHAHVYKSKTLANRCALPCRFIEGKVAMAMCGSCFKSIILYSCFDSSVCHCWHEQSGLHLQIFPMGRGGHVAIPVYGAINCLLHLHVSDLCLVVTTPMTLTSVYPRMWDITHSVTNF